MNSMSLVFLLHVDQAGHIFIQPPAGYLSIHSTAIPEAGEMKTRREMYAKKVPTVECISKSDICVSPVEWGNGNIKVKAKRVLDVANE